MWEGVTLNLISIYVPPRLQEQVLPELGALLLDLPTGTLVTGWDYNAIMNRSQDRWPASTKLPLVGFVKAFGLTDLWRVK